MGVSVRPDGRAESARGGPAGGCWPGCGARNSHELRAAALAAGLDGEGAGALAALLELCGPAATVLPRAEKACRNGAMRAAVAELRAAVAGAGQGVQIDLSLSGEMEYYNGLIFQGYLQGAPRPVLRGRSVRSAGPQVHPLGRGRWGLPSIWMSWTGWPPRPQSRPRPSC